MSDLPKTLPADAGQADRVCRKAKPIDKDLYIKDSKVTGLVFRVTKAGKKSWQLRYSVKIGGEWKGRKTTLASFDTGTGTKAARDMAEAMRGDIHKGSDPVGDKRADEEKQQEALRLKKLEQLSRVTMQDLFDTWLKLKLQNPKNGHKDGGEWAGGIIRSHILTSYADLEVKQFGVPEFNAIADPLIHDGRNRVANVLLSLTKQMLGFAIAREYIDSNPLDRIKRDDVGGQGVERDRVLCSYEDPDTHKTTPDELGELFAKLPLSGLAETSQAALHICLSTCCRIGELLKARWADVDLESAEWLIPVENSKNGKPHLINLSDYALAQFKILQSINGDSEWVYPSRRVGGHICPKTVTKQVGDRQRPDGGTYTNRAKNHKALELPRGKWTPHDLRRTGATMMAGLGVMGAVIERCLNHVEDNKVARIYNRHNPRDEMREAWQLLGAELQRIAGGEIEQC